jgi:glycosyltransferase involved in cell wall biosynthesis
METELLFREAHMRDLFDSVDCFIAPSKFLKARLIEYGLDSDRVLYSDYGTPVEDFVSDGEPSTGGPLRIGFLGSMQQVKGVHVLMEALQLLEPGSFTADFYGNISIKPEYVRDLRGPAGEVVRVMGEAPAKDIPSILRGFDVLAVPSIWWENSPLVIHEAFAAGVPVVCSDIGGMAELVNDGVSGLLFEAGSPEALAASLATLIEHPDRLRQLRAGIPSIKTMQDDADFHLELFQSILDIYTEG